MDMLGDILGVLFYANENGRPLRIDNEGHVTPLVLPHLANDDR